MRLRLNATLNALALVATMGMGLPFAAQAHGDWPPQHGGVMNDDDEMSFEMVDTQSGVRIYVSDHGEPVDVSGGTPMLTITRAGQALSAIQGSAVSRDQLDFSKLDLAAGDVVSVRIVMPNGAIYVGRFSLKNWPPATKTR